jgi:hypothetical protein
MLKGIPSQGATNIGYTYSAMELDMTNSRSKLPPLSINRNEPDLLLILWNRSAAAMSTSSALSLAEGSASTTPPTALRLVAGEH